MLAVGAVIALTGCGGSDDEDTGATTTDSPVTTAEDKRLSQASWDEYVAARDEAQKVNQQALTTFAKCRDLIARNLESEQIQKCFGTTASNVVTEGQQFEATLTGFEGEVGGACAKALTNYAGSVKLYVASVNALATSESTTPNATQVDEANEALTMARTTGLAFEAACKPTA